MAARSAGHAMAEVLDDSPSPHAIVLRGVAHRGAPDVDPKHRDVDEGRSRHATAEPATPTATRHQG
jgi:hypothetical protein